MQEGRAFGSLGYEFDGNYLNNVNRAYGSEDVWVYDWMRKNGSDLVIYAGYMFASDILNYNNHETVPECFKMSAIKNVATGEEYIASGAINLDGSAPDFTEYLSGNLVLKQIVNPTYIPERTTYYSVSASELENKTFYFNRGSEYCTFTMEHADSGSVFVVEYTGAYRNQDFVPYTQKITKATGMFSDCHLSTKDSYIYVMGVDTVAAATASGTVTCARGVISNISASMWFDTIPQNTTPITQSGPQGACLGAITYDGLGNVVQYTGETNANYTNGYFYKATGTAVVTPSTISFTDLNPSDCVVTVSDPDALITAMNNVGGWGEQWVKERLMYEWTSFQVDYNFDTGTVTRVWWSAFGDFYNQYVLDCFAVSTTSSYTGEVTVSFVCQQGYVPESRDVQNPAWVRVDVQPGGGGGAVSSVNGQTGTVVLGAADVNAVPSAGGTMTGNLTMGTGTRINVTSEYTSSGYLEAKILNVSGALKFVGNNDPETGIVMGLGHGSLDGRFLWQGLYPINTSSFGATLGTINHKWSFLYCKQISNGETISIPGVAGKMAIQVSSLPTASASNEGEIYQYIGATDSTYTNGYFYKCVSDGAVTPTYSWEAVSVQAGGGGSLPSQTGNAGKFLTTDGMNASWADILTSTTATLAVADWSNGSQTVNVTGVTATNIIMVGAAPSSVTEYNTCGVLCTAQGAGTLTFTCTSTPSNDLTVNVLIM
jgi:hypothetical protein